MIFSTAIISGIILGLGLIFPQIGFTAYLFAVPFFVVLFKYLPEKQNKAKYAYIITLIFAFSFYSVGFSSLLSIYPLDFAGISNGLSIALLILAVVILAGSNAVIMGFAGFFTVKLYDKIGNGKLTPVISAAFFAAFWTLGEYLQSLIGIPFVHLSYTQVNSLEAMQISSVFGNMALSYVIIFVNILLAFLMISLLEQRFLADKQALYAIIAAGIAFLGNFTFGIFKTIGFENTELKKINVALIQGDVSTYEKWETADGPFISLAKYKELTRRVLTENENIDLIVWPESAFCVLMDSANKNLISSFARECNTSLLIGAYEGTLDEYYNSLLLFNEDGEHIDSYHKQKLVPFGEYCPKILQKILPFITNLNLSGQYKAKGEQSKPISFDNENLGALICFDLIYENVARKEAQSGAGLFISASNYAWFEGSSAISQMNGHAAFRAVENGKYVLNVTNIGVSSVISPYGQTIDEIDVHEKNGYIVYQAPIIHGKTIYTQIGDVFPISCAIFAIVGVIWTYLPQKNLKGDGPYENKSTDNQ